MSFAKKMVLLFVVLCIPVAASATSFSEIQQIYAEWLQHYADRQPEQAIAMTSDDFVMVNGETVMDRDEALAFTQGLAAFILSRECTDFVLTDKELPQKSRLLLSRVDCVFHTVQGDLPGHFLETIIVDKQGVILYDHFTTVAE